MTDRSLYEQILESFAQGFVLIEEPTADVSGDEVVWLAVVPTVQTTLKVIELFPEVVWC